MKEGAGAKRKAQQRVAGVVAPSGSMSVVVRVVALVPRDGLLVLTTRSHDGKAALPHALLHVGFAPEQAVGRALDASGLNAEVTSLLDATFGPGDDGVLTLSYLTLLPTSTAQPSGPLQFIPFTEAAASSAIDNGVLHRARVVALNRVEDLREMVGLVGEPFTLSELRRAYESLLGRTLEPANFTHRLRPAKRPTAYLKATGGIRGTAGRGRESQLLKLAGAAVPRMHFAEDP